MKRILFFVSIIFNAQAILEESLPELNTILEIVKDQLTENLSLVQKKWQLKLFPDDSRWQLDELFNQIKSAHGTRRQNDIEKIKNVLSNKPIEIVEFDFYPGSTFLNFIEKQYKITSQYQIKDLMITNVKRDQDNIVFGLKAFYDTKGIKIVDKGAFLPFLDGVLTNAHAIFKFNFNLVSLAPTYYFDGLKIVIQDKDKDIETQDIKALNEFLLNKWFSIVPYAFDLSHEYKKDIPDKDFYIKNRSIKFVPLKASLQ